VVCLAARQHDVTVLALSPAEVKRAVTANGAASKEQVQRSVGRLLGLGRLPTPSHVADALALALTGLSRLGGRLQWNAACGAEPGRSSVQATHRSRRARGPAVGGETASGAGPGRAWVPAPQPAW